MVNKHEKIIFKKPLPWNNHAVNIHIQPTLLTVQEQDLEIIIKFDPIYYPFRGLSYESSKLK
jgi:hypothetical protein